MSSEKQLEEIYREVADGEQVTLFVAPPIRYGYKRSDYLYLLYKDLFKSTRYNIQSISRFAHLKPVLKSARKSSSIFHYHWLECAGFLNLPLFLFNFLCLVLYAKTGGNLVWTIHNKMPLDGKYRWLNFKTRRWLAQNAKIIHIQCRSAIPEICSFYGVDESKIRFYPHPSYPRELMPRATAVEAINHRFDVNIKIQDRIFLMIGHISTYKQIYEVCEIFRNQPVQKKMVIAGPVKRGQMKTYKKIRKIADKTDNIFLIPHFIREECVPEFMNAADVLVFNFRGLLSSGGIHLAASYNKPIIMPHNRCIEELEYDKFHLFDSVTDLNTIISDW